MNNSDDKKGMPIIISGSAGAGKGTILAELMKKDEKYKMSVSAVTREPRPGEVHGVNYYFISSEEFQKFIDEGSMIEYVEYSGNFYGTPKDFAEKSLDGGFNLIFEIEPRGAMNIKEIFPNAVMIFIVPPTYDELVRRLTERKTETEEKIRKRLEISKKEILYLPKYEYFFVNENGKQAESAENIHKIINIELKRKRMAINKTEEDFLKDFSASPERIKTFLENYY